MTEAPDHHLPSRRGALYYKPSRERSVARFPFLLAERRARCSRIITSEILGVPKDYDPVAETLRKKPRPSIRPKGRLATVREDTFRRLRSLIASHAAGPKEDSLAPPRTSSRRGSRQDEATATQEMPGPDFLRASQRNSISNGSTIPSPARSRQNSAVSMKPPTIPEEKPVASGHGVSVSVNLAEPVLFLQGFEPGEAAQRNTAMLRGTLHLKVAKSAKIKAVSLKFKGTACTKWPEGMLRRANFDDGSLTEGRHPP